MLKSRILPNSKIMKYGIIIFLLIGCSTNKVADQKNEDNRDEMIIDLIENWFVQNKYKVDTSRFNKEIFFSNGLGPSGFIDVSFFPPKVLRDSVRIKFDSAKINQVLNSKFDFDKGKHKVQFFFSNFIFDSTRSNAISNLSIFYLNESEDRIIGGNERIVIYKKEKDSWEVKDERVYLDY